MANVIGALPRCVVEILIKLGATALQGLCDFIQNKITLLERYIDMLNAYGFLEDEMNRAQQKLGEVNALIDNFIANNPLITIARSLHPECAELADIFQGVIGAGRTLQTAANDVLYTVRQYVTLRGVFATIINESKQVINFLRSVCSYIQYLLVSKAHEIAEVIVP